MSNRKTRVLSVRLDLATLQSCFDLCEALDSPSQGASGAIARSLTILMSDLRSKGTLPTYKNHELSTLLQNYQTAKNPTSMASLETLSNFERHQKVSLTNQDFNPSMLAVEEGEVDKISTEADSDYPLNDLDEYNDLLESKIREQQDKESEDLLSKLLI